MDLNLSNDEFESYRIFQTRVVEQYESMVTRDRFAVIDGTLDIEEQQNQMRRHVSKLLPPPKTRPTVAPTQRQESRHL